MMHRRRRCQTKYAKKKYMLFIVFVHVSVAKTFVLDQSIGAQSAT